MAESIEDSQQELHQQQPSAAAGNFVQSSSLTFDRPAAVGGSSDRFGFFFFPVEKKAPGLEHLFSFFVRNFLEGEIHYEQIFFPCRPVHGSLMMNERCHRLLNSSMTFGEFLFQIFPFLKLTNSLKN